MNNYTLQENETILFRGSCAIMQNGKKNEKTDEANDIILTNNNIVLFVKRKKFLKTVEEVQVFNVLDVKTYDETVQIIRRKSIVDIYLKECELFLDFLKEKYAKEFCDKALRLISGYSKFVRGVKKTQKAVKETTEALDIDIAEAVRSGTEFVCDVVLESDIPIASKGGKKITTAIAKVVHSRIGKKEKQPLIEAQRDKDEISENQPKQ